MHLRSVVARGSRLSRASRSWLAPSAARGAQLMAPTLAYRSVVMRARPRVRALRPPQARRVKWEILRSTTGRAVLYRSFQAGSRWTARACWSTASCGGMAMVRPRAEAVQAARSGQVPHQGRNAATPPRGGREVSRGAPGPAGPPAVENDAAAQ